MQTKIKTIVFIMLAFGITASQAETLSSPTTQSAQNDIEESYTKDIYIWTDSNGIQHFGNKLPPEGARDVKVISPAQSPPTVETNQSEIKKEQNYNRMVEKARSDTRELEKKRKSQKAAAAAEKQRRAENERNARIDAERKKLQSEIDAINARGLSPTFSKGMKDALIRKVQEKIDKLEKDPAAYFQSE